MSRGNKDMMYNPKAFPLLYTLKYFVNEEYKYHKSFCKDTKAFCRSRYKDMIYNSKPFPLCIKLKAFCKNTADQKSFLLKHFPNSNSVYTIPVSNP